LNISKKVKKIFQKEELVEQGGWEKGPTTMIKLEIMISCYCLMPGTEFDESNAVAEAVAGAVCGNEEASMLEGSETVKPKSLSEGRLTTCAGDGISRNGGIVT